MIKTFLLFTAKVALAMIVVEIVDSFTGIFTTIRTTARGLIPSKA